MTAPARPRPAHGECRQSSDIPECDRPETVAAEILDELRHAIDSHPRTLQTAVGPSEIGEPCDRALIARLCNLPQPEEPPNLRAWVGTAMHAQLERVIEGWFVQRGTAGPRFLTETRVTVGQLGSAPLRGSCDLFDTAAGIVWDWKSKSKTQLAQHRLHGPGTKYLVQFHCYGLGMENAGHAVSYVGAIYIPRDGDYSDIFHWAQPYDRQIALDAVARANRLLALTQLIGTQQAINQYPPCDGPFCRTCGNYRAPYGAPKAPATSTRELLAR